MAEIAESMLDGSMCELCGEYLGEAVGHVRRCAECADDGDPMIETFRILKKQNQEKRAHNRKVSQVELVKRGYDFEVKNGDAHLIVKTAVGVVDFWPGTGKFRIRSTGAFGRGLDALFESCPVSSRKPEGEPLVIPYAPHMSRFTIEKYLAAGFVITGMPSEEQ